MAKEIIKPDFYMWATSIVIQSDREDLADNIREALKQCWEQATVYEANNGWADAVESDSTRQNDIFNALKKTH